jgi:hypothetical protein
MSIRNAKNASATSNIGGNHSGINGGKLTPQAFLSSASVGVVGSSLTVTESTGMVNAPLLGNGSYVSGGNDDGSDGSKPLRTASNVS